MFHHRERMKEMVAISERRIVLLTSHVFLPGYRKASIHFVAERWAARGHQVRFLTIGHSWLTRFKDRPRFDALREHQANRFHEVQPRLQAGAWLPPVHAFSSDNGFLNRVNARAFSFYASQLPDFAREEIADADLLVVESGSALCFFDEIRRLNAHARTLYFCRDLLQTVGAAPALQEMERKAIPRFDRICVPSHQLGEKLPAGGRVRFVPQGVDKRLFDRPYLNPYQPGSRNAVSVGNMLFDERAVAAMAKAAPDVMFHIFGTAWKGAPLPNVIIYGERAFDSIVPYICHADIGLAPYRLTEGEAYLSESSLKLPQYSYCRLPILLPDMVPFRRANAIPYRLDGETDWRGKIDTALAMPRDGQLRRGILSWDDVAAATLEAAFED